MVDLLTRLENTLVALNTILVDCKEQANEGEEHKLVKLIEEILYGEVCDHRTDICGGTIRAEKRVRYRRQIAELESIPTREENDDRP